ncbi:MAG: hypothetical protein IPL61_36615 [Myxococcales bacterium]|nr:hypothetical protein [Myxococcales bacterium]
MRRIFCVLAVAAACGGGPALRNAPRPDPAVVAAAATAVATAATIADPQGAARKAEQKGGRPEGHVVGGDRSMPADVLDRLDRHQVEVAVDAGVDGPAAARVGVDAAVQAP